MFFKLKFIISFSKETHFIGIDFGLQHFAIYIRKNLKQIF